MPAPSPSWNTVRVHGTWVNLDGTLKAGNYFVTVPVRVTNATDDVIIPAGLFDADMLNTTSGVPSLDLQIPAGDDPDNLPTSFQIIVKITFTDGSKPELYALDIPVALSGDEDGINLRTVVLLQELPQDLKDVLIRSVPGGVAGLNVDGDVIDAAGNVIVSGISQGTLDDALAVVQADVDDKVDEADLDAQTRALVDDTGSDLHAGLSATIATVKAWARNPDQLIAGAVTRDANGAATGAPVAWPDGSPGTYTADAVSSAFPGAVDAYHITYGSPVTKTFTQPAVTRNADGAPTNVPAIVVS